MVFGCLGVVGLGVVWRAVGGSGGGASVASVARRSEERRASSPPFAWRPVWTRESLWGRRGGLPVACAHSFGWSDPRRAIGPLRLERPVFGTEQPPSAVVSRRSPTSEATGAAISPRARLTPNERREGGGTPPRGLDSKGGEGRGAPPPPPIIGSSRPPAHPPTCESRQHTTTTSFAPPRCCRSSESASGVRASCPFR